MNNEESSLKHDPWSEWWYYYDTNPVPFPRRCICCKRVFTKKDSKAELEHTRDCVCVTNLRTWPPFGSLDSDLWEPVKN